MVWGAHVSCVTICFGKTNTIVLTPTQPHGVPQQQLGSILPTP